MLETCCFSRSITFIYSFQKYLNTMLFRQNFSWRQQFLFKIFQIFVSIAPFSNCYTYATNKGENNIDFSLERTKLFAQNFFNSKLNLLVKCYEKWITETNFIKKKIWQWFKHILASLLYLHWVTVDKISIIHKWIKLLVWNFQKTCKTNFYTLKFSRPSASLTFSY